MSFALTQSLWARGVAEALRGAGVADVIVSPGSRSTPLVQAVTRAQLSVRAIIDERSAGFFALGMARANGRPVALLCTSGSAAGHYLPAIIEAHHARVPLVVITADRPPELRDCAAPQAMNQVGLYGERVRQMVELGVASEDARAVRGMRRRIAQAVSVSRAPNPGPVHINVPLRKPLELVEAGSAQERARVRAVEAILAEPLTVPWPAQLRAAEEAIASLAQAVNAAERAVIVAGPLSASHGRERPTHTTAGGPYASAIFSFAEAANLPVFTEAASGLRFHGASLCANACDAYDLLYRSEPWAAAHRPDLIIQIGAPPISTAWNRLVTNHPVIPRYIITEHDWPDPMSSATAIVRGDIADTLERVVGHVDAPAPPWTRELLAANHRAWQIVEAELANRGTLSEAQAMRAIVAATPDAAQLVIGNSLPVRTIDAFCPGTSRAVRVLTQRGVNGIDGIVSGAAGAAATTEGPTVAILGDVSFTHDLGGLAATRDLASPLAIVIIDNDGGRIFDHLPIAASEPSESYATSWLTPPTCDFCAAAALFGAGYAEVDSAAALKEAVQLATGSAGCTLIRAKVAAQSAAEGLARITAAITEQLA